MSIHSSQTIPILGDGFCDSLLCYSDKSNRHAGPGCVLRIALRIVPVMYQCGQS
jgi:hypothetical protein